MFSEVEPVHSDGYFRTRSGMTAFDAAFEFIVDLPFFMKVQDFQYGPVERDLDRPFAPDPFFVP